MHRLKLAEQVLRDKGHTVQSLPTTGPRTAGGIAHRCLTDGTDLVIAAGGDGTINEVVEGLAGSELPLGILPAGTANVLANEMAIPRKLHAAAGNLDTWEPRRISLGHFDDAAGRPHHFLLMAGAGLDAKIVYDVHLPLKQRVGKLSYWLAGFRQFGHDLEEFDVTIDGTARRCSFALITKVRNYGGDFEIARNVTLLDDEFEVVLFEGRRSMLYVKYLFGITTKSLKGMSGVSIHRAAEISLSPSNGNRVHLQADGEHVGRLPANIRIAPDALTLLMPPAYPRK